VKFKSVAYSNYNHEILIRELVMLLFNFHFYSSIDLIKFVLTHFQVTYFSDESLRIELLVKNSLSLGWFSIDLILSYILWP
jgi:hypothetical protein